MTAPIAPGTVTSLAPFLVQLGADGVAQPCQRVAPAQIGQRGGVLILGGQRVWLGAYDKSDVDVSGLTARISALETAGPWTDCTLGAGVTGSARVRKLGPTLAEISVSLTGSFVDGNTLNICTIPAGYRPVGGEARVGGYHGGGYIAMCFLVASGAVGVTQRSGATRTTLLARGTYGLT